MGGVRRKAGDRVAVGVDYGVDGLVHCEETVELSDCRSFGVEVLGGKTGEWDPMLRVQ